MIASKELLRRRPSWLVRLVAVASAAGLAGCSAGRAPSASHPATGESSTGGAGSAAAVISVVAAEEQYGDVAAQIGGSYVQVRSVMAGPAVDPHSYELSPSVARSVASARIVVQNGLGYDGFMSKIEAASPRSGRRVIDVQHLLGLPDSTRNPHLWYLPATMPKVAAALADDLSALDPPRSGYFLANARRFDETLQPWLDQLASWRAGHPGVPVATTEPIADYMLEAAGFDNLTPWSFQADVMNGVDPAPQDITIETQLIQDHRVRALVYNRQVTDSLTKRFVQMAIRAGVARVGVYEIMPPGEHYQQWMLTTTLALEQAVAS